MDVSVTALVAAAERGDAATVDFLLSSGVDGDGCDEHGETALLRASLRGHHLIVKTLLDWDANVNTSRKLGRKGKAGATALMLAASFGSDKCVRLLLDFGADVHARDEHEHRQTALIKAAGWGRTAAVGMLIDAGAYINAQDAYGHTPLLMAAGTITFADPALIRLFLARGADVGLTNCHGQTALMKAAAAGQAESVRILLEYNARFIRLTKMAAMPC